MRSIQKVVIQRAEGRTDHYTMKKVTYEGDTAEAKGNKWLHEIAKTAPKSGYDKTDVWVTLSNSEEYEFRFDVHHTSLPDNDTNIRKHMRDWLRFICRPEEFAHIARDPERLKYIQSQTTPEQKAYAESVLALIDADNPVAA